jgi:hypothetical protein
MFRFLLPSREPRLVSGPVVIRTADFIGSLPAAVATKFFNLVPAR